MTFAEYPKTDAQCIAYAQQIAENKGEKRHALRLAKNNAYGITHAVCADIDLPDYLAAGADLIDPAE